MFPRLEREIDGVEGREAVMVVLEDPALTEFRSINVLPLIYDESRQSCNILGSTISGRRIRRCGL
jgi:hypothetical protein